MKPIKPAEMYHETSQSTFMRFNLNYKKSDSSTFMVDFQIRFQKHKSYRI